MHLSLERKSNKEIEQVLRSANSMNDIRTKSLKEAWIKSVEPLKRILEDRTSRLKLKKDPFVVHSAANAGLYNNFFSNLSLWANNFLD